MKIIDFLVLIPLIWGAYEGYKRGFFMTVMSLLAIILGVIGGFKLMQVGIYYLKDYFPNMPKMLPFISFTLLFIGIVTVIYLLSIAVKKVINFSVFAGTLDNFFGAVVCAVQWAFITSILLWLCKQIKIIPVRYTDGASVYDFMVYLAPKTINWTASVIPYSNGLFQSVKQLF